MDRRRFLLTSVAGVMVQPLAARAQQADDVPRLTDPLARLSSLVDQTFPSLRGRAALMLVVLAVFVVIAGSVGWRHRESVFDTIEFEGGRLFKKAVITTLVLAAVAFLTLVIINNR